MLIALIIKRYLILVLSAIFSLYIKLHYEITGLLTRILPAATYTSRHLVHTQTMCQDSHRVRFECFIQIIAGSSISLILSLTVINYQQLFFDAIILVAHHVHRWYWSIVLFEIPDYSQSIYSCQWIKQSLTYLLIFFGYMGMPAQITFTTDLIYLFNLPTILIYQLLAFLYSKIIATIVWIMPLLFIKRQDWISCTIQTIYLRPSFTLLYVGLLILLLYAVAIVAFYYIWLAIVLALLKILLNALVNLSVTAKNLGAILLALKGIDFDEQAITVPRRSLFQKLCDICQKSGYAELFNYQQIMRIFRGKDLFIKLLPMLIVQAPLPFATIYRSLTLVGLQRNLK